MKKKKTKEQKVIDRTLKHVNKILKTVGKATCGNTTVEDRFYMHHCLLDMVSSVGIILNGYGFSKTDGVIKRIKEVAEKVAPTSGLECYT